MRLTINNKNFGDLRTAVFYREHKYLPIGDIIPDDIPGLIQDCTSDRIQYQGSKSRLSGMDFAEYDFSYFIEKYKFNDNFLISLLDDQSKDLVGKNIDDLEKIESVLFPTLKANKSISGKQINYDYFGTALIANQNFLLFDTPGRNSDSPGYYKIELYEEVLESNNETGGFIEYELLKKLELSAVAPSVTIILGPSRNVKNNQPDMYFPYDTLNDRSESLGIVEYRKLREEVNCSKIVYLYLTKENEVLDINLAYKSWVDSNNPNRKAKDYIIRNDEYYSTRNNIDILENLEDSDFWFDSNSGTLVGNSEHDHTKECPLLRKKLVKSNSNFYSPYVRYNKGDIVRYGSDPSGEPYYWESLVDNNYHTNPFISSDWIESTRINNYFTRRINILIYPLGAGSSIPGGSITVNSENQAVSFTIQSNPGYNIYYRSKDLSDEMNHHIDSCYLTNPGKENSVQFRSEDEEGNIVWTYSSKDSGGVIVETITVNKWKPFFELDETGAYKYNDLIFNFGIAKSFISFEATDGVITGDYKDWGDYFGEPGFKIDNIVTISSEGVENSPNSSEIERTNKLAIDSGSKIVMLVPELSSHSIDYIESSYRVGNNIGKKKIYPRILNNNSFEFSDIINFSEATYLFKLVAKTLTIKVGKFDGYIVNEVISRVKYGNDYLFRFYSTSDSGSFNKLTITGDKGEKVVYLPGQINTESDLGGATLNLTIDENDSSIYSLSIKEVKSNYTIILE